MAELEVKNELQEVVGNINHVFYKLEQAGIKTLSELDMVVALSEEITQTFKKCVTPSGYTTDDIIGKTFTLENFSSQYEPTEVYTTGYCSIGLNVKVEFPNDKYIIVTRHADYNYHDNTAILNNDMDIETETGITNYIDVDMLYKVDSILADIMGVG